MFNVHYKPGVGKLWPVGWIQPAFYFCMIYKLNIIFTFVRVKKISLFMRTVQDFAYKVSSMYYFLFAEKDGQSLL